MNLISKTISIITIIILCIVALAALARADNDIGLPEGYQTITEEKEALLEKAGGKQPTTILFPFGWKEDSGKTVFLCKVKILHLVKYYFAEVTIIDEDGRPMITDILQIADSDDEELCTAYNKARPVKTLDEYDIYEIVANEELLTEYKATHNYLDDMHFWDVPEDKLLCQIGYSYIWNVLAVVYKEDDHEELFADVPDHIFYSFMQASDKALFFSMGIQGIYQQIQLPEQPDLSEYVIIK